MEQTKLIQSKLMKGFSLVETLITLAIFGILMAMLSQILIINISISRKTFARSRIRDEMSELVTLIQRDIRNAKIIGECGEKTEGSETFTECQIYHAEEFVWTDNCPDEGEVQRLCKLTVVDPAIPGDVPDVLFQTSDLINVDDFGLEVGLSQGDDGTKSTILVTVLASSANENFEVNNQVRQIAVSTRNFTLGDFFLDQSEPEEVICNYNSTQIGVRKQGDNDWNLGSLDLLCGETFEYASFHNNNLNQVATDTTMNVSGPGVTRTTRGTGQLTTSVEQERGTYTINVITDESNGQACESTGIVNCFRDPAQFGSGSQVLIPPPDQTTCAGTPELQGVCGSNSYSGSLFFGALNESCDETCDRAGGTCELEDFDPLREYNDCDIVSRFVTDPSNFSCNPLVSNYGPTMLGSGLYYRVSNSPSCTLKNNSMHRVCPCRDGSGETYTNSNSPTTTTTSSAATTTSTTSRRTTTTTSVSPCRCYNGYTCNNTYINPNNTYCGYTVCGRDWQLYRCWYGGWQALGTGCNQCGI
ncbi:MAG: PilW family protein [Candidatus Dojkabacteria bacterium]